MKGSISEKFPMHKQPTSRPRKRIINKFNENGVFFFTDSLHFQEHDLQTVIFLREAFKDVLADFVR